MQRVFLFISTFLVLVCFRECSPRAQTCTSLGQQCLDENTWIVCAEGNDDSLIEIGRVTCSSLNVSFCCNKQRNQCDIEGCGLDEYGLRFKCIKEGVYPDPNNCTRFHECDKDLTHFEGVCDGSEFNANTSGCGPSENSNCSRDPFITFNCDDPVVHAFVFPQYPRYFAYCIPTAYGLYTVQECRNNEVFDESRGRCEPVVICSGYKVYPDEEDCHNYFKCSGANEQPMLQRCPDGQGFDPKLLACVPENLVEACGTH